jgi:hypothetical protein
LGPGFGHKDWKEQQVTAPDYYLNHKLQSTTALALLQFTEYKPRPDSFSKLLRNYLYLIYMYSI